MTVDSSPSYSASVQRVRVVIVGAGPAGLTVANILRAASVDC
ncbi:cation diffusion facilitator CzcD-associated flavoprotein CzcO [Streptomyces sp. V1I1]|nr:cation diffusion facilitator CzcD-associated flavoprotein CzcO [Streptomyces sp. V1I1]